MKNGGMNIYYVQKRECERLIGQAAMQNIIKGLGAEDKNRKSYKSFSCVLISSPGWSLSLWVDGSGGQTKLQFQWSGIGRDRAQARTYPLWCLLVKAELKDIYEAKQKKKIV